MLTIIEIIDLSVSIKHANKNNASNVVQYPTIWEWIVKNIRSNRLQKDVVIVMKLFHKLIYKDLKLYKIFAILKNALKNLN